MAKDYKILSEELQAKVTELESKLADPEGYVKALETKIAELETSHAEKVAELEKTIVEQNAVIESLMETQKVQEKEMAAGAPVITVDKVDYLVTQKSFSLKGIKYTVNDLKENKLLAETLIKMKSNILKPIL